MQRVIPIAALGVMLLTLMLAGCTDDPALSLDEYLAELDCESLESNEEPATYNDLSVAFTEAVERMSALAPPGEVAEWHQVRLDGLQASSVFIDQQPQDEEIDFAVILLLVGVVEEFEPREMEAITQMSDATRNRMVDAGCIDQDDVARLSVAGPDDHGNEIEDATIVQVGVPIAGVIGENDRDVFHFTADGRYFYQFDIELGTLTGATLTLLDSVGETLARTEPTPDGPPLHLIGTTSEPGDYYVQVSGWFSGSPSSGLGSYTLTVSPSEFVDDHGDVPGSATLIPLGVAIAGSIDVSREVDYFRLTVEERGHYQIHVSIGSLDNDDVPLNVQRKDIETGHWTSSDVYAGSTDDGPDCGTPHTTCIDLQPGDHLFRVGSYGDGTGTYTLTVTEIEGE